MQVSWSSTLSKLAADNRLVQADSRMWHRPLKADSFHGLLQVIAMQVQNRRSMNAQESLDTFFGQAAQHLLLALPNGYWFWTVVHKAIQLEDDDATVIGAEAVRKAMGEMRHSVALSICLRKPMEHLTQTEVCLRLAAGVYIIGGGKTWEIVVNPIFA